MSDPTPQTYSNHVRRLPRPYLAAGAGIALAIVFAVANAVMHPSWHAALLAVFAVSLFGTHWYERTNALVVQNRVIRLEERLRLERLLPQGLRARIGELSVDQLVALRFASDAELPELTRQVLDEKLSAKDEIKRRVRDWRADHLRV
jgi:hypothetical protein